MNKRKRGHNRTLGFWLALESIVVTLAAVAPFALLHLVNRFYWLRASTVLALGMLVIMGSVVGITATLFSRRFNQMVSGLTRGLRAVADGDFSQRLEPEEGGPLQPAYEDFNKMSMELQSIQTLRADFINHFSHEFKTPITAIKGFAELLREPDTTPEPDHSGRVLPPGRPGQQHPAAHQAGVPAVHRGEAPLLSGRADQAVRHPPLPRLGEKADLLHR